ncbi:c-type lysozyme inhibitor [Klebsiella pneumoniae]|uniref:c-type lysozyme inhibitor n=1 Tax=Klebsiella pneumoniae TaxID=573 RepID=UPI002E821B56|nr:c-type lysozyme inhibitor [Klebsiella pneumoniae]MEE2541526.1 c-type lysozyme inhibitor [Klebsiella pneumoniae]
MKSLFSSIVLLALSVSGGAMADEVTHTQYACDDSKTLDVVYIGDYAVIQQMDELIPMKRAVSGSGMRYVPLNKDYIYELWGKGSNMNLSTYDGKKNEDILSNCKP